MTERENKNIKCEIVERIGVLNTYPTGWSKELNLVKWNDKQVKYDLRDWAPGHERMSKGVTMHEDEVRKLMELCEGRLNSGAVEEVVPQQVSTVAETAADTF